MPSRTQILAPAERLSSDALLVGADPFFMVQREYLVALVSEQKISAVYPFRELTDVGGLISYGTNIANAYRQSGALKDFTGVDAALGLTIPASIVARARRGDRTRRFLLRCMSPLLALSGHLLSAIRCPLLGVKQTWARPNAMSAFDPKRTLAAGAGAVQTDL